MGRQRLGRVASWLPLLVLLVVALHPRHPILVGLRAVETPLLIGLGVVCLAWVVRRLARKEVGRWEGRVRIGLLVAVIALVFGNEAEFQRQRTEVLAAEPAARLLGQHFIVGYSRFDEAARLAERGLIGGLYLSHRNVHGRSVEAVRAEIDALQALRAAAGLPPLLVAADQEGGSVAHMTPPLGALPPLASLVQAGDDENLETRARTYGEVQGRGLAALGVNLNFGPVVDLRPVRGGPAFDTHTLIRQRAIATDPEVVTRVARAYSEGLIAAGVRPTLKHFPGLGRVRSDTHHFAGRLDTATARLAATDWQPFRGTAPLAGAMMLAHVVLADVDPAQPTSLSKPVVQQLLRKDWGYDGLLITDDLDMGAVYRRGICKAAVAALEAGVDMLLVSYDPDQYYRAMHCAAGALRRGELAGTGLADGKRRIGALVNAGKSTVPAASQGSVEAIEARASASRVTVAQSMRSASAPASTAIPQPSTRPTK